MKVLVVSHSYSTQENRKNILELLTLCQVQVALPDRLYDTIRGELTNADGKSGVFRAFRRLSGPRSQYLLASPSLGMKSFAPDIIHVEYDPWSVIFWQVAVYRWLYVRHAKLICTVKKNTYRQLPLPLELVKNAIARFFISRVSHFIAISTGVRDIYQERFKVPATRISVMQHLGLDLELFAPRDKPWQRLHRDEFIIGYCGRLDADKGIEDLLAAVQNACPGTGTGVGAGTGTTVRVRLLGNGRLRDELLKRGDEWLEILDPVPNDEVAGFLRGIDLFVLPSRVIPDHEEHDAHALLEALACGVPSIGSTSGIIPQVLDNGCGLVFEAADISQLSERIAQLIADENLRKSLSLRALQAASTKFSVAGIAQQKFQIYERLLP